MYSKDRIKELLSSDAQHGFVESITTARGMKIFVAILWMSAIMVLAFSKGSTGSVIKDFPVVVPPAKLQRSPYSTWVHGHWVRLHQSLQSETSVYDLLQHYKAHNIPVHVITLDEGWADKADTFTPNRTLFPNFETFIENLHKDSIKVVLSSNPFLQVETAAFVEAKARGFMVNEGKTITIEDRGEGGLLDYSNPDALKWWHKLMDKALKLKIDGWKNEGVDPYIRNYGGIGVVGKAGFMDTKTWSRKYYWDYLDYSRKVNGFDMVTMFRPVDSWKNFKYIEFGPTDISFACWVGDHQATFEGLRESLMNMFHSAKKKYLNLGSAVGGTGDTHLDKPAHKELFIRWVQLGTFTPIFENGGMGYNHAPWAFDAETVQIYRKLVNLHSELEPFFVSEAGEAFIKHDSVLKSIHAEIMFADPDSWDFLVGDDILVAPITRPHGEITLRNVTFPMDSEWTDWWDPYKVYRPGERLELFVPVHHFPVFKRRGTIIPMSITLDSSDYGRAVSANALTLVIDQPRVGGTEVSRKVFGEHDTGFVLLYSTRLTLNGRYILQFTLTSYVKPIILLIRGVKISDIGEVVVSTNHGATFTLAISKDSFFEHVRNNYRNAVYVHKATVIHSDVWIFYAQSRLGGLIDVGGLVTPTEQENAHRKMEV